MNQGNMNNYDEQVVPTNGNNSPQMIPVKSNKGLIITLIVIILALAGVLAYVLLFNKEDNNTKEPEKEQQEKTQENNNEEEKEEPQEDNKEETENNETEDKEKTNNEETQNTPAYDLTVYKYKDGGGYLTDSSEKDDYLTTAFTIKVNSKKAKVVAVNYNSRDLVLYDDEGLYIYNNKTKKSQKIDLANTFKNYNILLSEDYSKVIGIGYKDNNGKFVYYNISKNKKLYTGKYKYDENFTPTQINDHYLSLHSNDTVYLLNTDSESVKLSYKDEQGISGYSSFGKDGNYIFALNSSMDVTQYARFYTKSFELFFGQDDTLIWDGNVSFVNNYLYFVIENTVYKYDMNGKLVSKYSDYSDIKMLAFNNVVYVKDGNLIVENVESNDDVKVITKWNEKWDFDTLDSRYYTRHELDIMGETNKKEGTYIVFEYGYDENGNAVKDSKGYYGMEYCFTSSKQVVEYPIKEEVGGRAKPVLYLYPTKETNVTVKFAHPELLTTTYPKYINSWNVTVKPNGDMIDSDGKYYYALYWDEKRYNEVDFKEGFYVEGKDAIKFLEEKLSIIGLSDKERNEFIMYWLPIMENNKKNLVYFELTKERELGNKLIINPKPDSLLRVSIHIKKVNQKTNIKEQKLETFKRSGFTAVEWGGMTY